jgi:hypothetical protein
MIPLQFVCWLIIITSEEQVFNRIMQRQLKITLGQQSLVVVRRPFIAAQRLEKTPLVW